MNSIVLVFPYTGYVPHVILVSFKKNWFMLRG